MSNLLQVIFWACLFLMILKFMVVAAIGVAVVAAVFVTLRLFSMA